MTDDTTHGSLSAFEQEIVQQEDIIYGVALYFECLRTIHADKQAIVETCRKQLRNVIQKGNERVSHARQLLEDAGNDPQKKSLVKQFTFSPCEGYQNPELMTRRAQTLVSTYNKVFAGRSRSKDLSDDEIFTLIEEASISFTEM